MDPSQPSSASLLAPPFRTHGAHWLAPTWGEALWLLACAGILAWKLLLPGFIGMADNGDFGKIAGPLCLVDADPEPWSFFSPLYLRGKQSSYNPHVPTSELALAWLASTVEQTVGDRTRFDIRWMGAVHGILFLSFYYSVLTLLRPLSGIARFTLSLLAIWIFADMGLLAYFNSFYSDVPAALGGLATAMFAANLLAARRLAPGALLLFGLAALLFITSKAQHGVFGFIPAALAFLSGWRASDKRTRATGHLVGMTLFVATAWIVGSTPGWYKAQSRFNLIFFKIAKASPSPARDLAELGLGPGDVRYIGLYSFAPGGPMENSAWADSFRIRSTYGQVLKFYFRHPRRALTILQSDLEDQAPQRRALGLSNFQKKSGWPQGAVDTSLSSWSALRAWASRVWPAHIVVWLVLLLPSALLCGIHDDSRWRRALAWTTLALCLVALGEFGIACLADAIETPRHLLLFHVFTDASIFLALAYVASVLETACPSSFRRPAYTLVAVGLAIFTASIVTFEVFAAVGRVPRSSGVLAGAVDDRSPAVVYSGHWLQGTFRSAFGGTLTYSDEAGATARFFFEGTELQYIHTKAYNRGLALVTIDGSPRRQIDLYDPSIVWQERTVFGGLKPGSHRAEIQVLGQRNAASSGNFVDIDALIGR
jgi:hypothetical protein